MTRVLHILPHPGGGGEGVIDLLIQTDPSRQAKFALSLFRRPALAAYSIAARYPNLRKSIDAADVVHILGDMAALLTLSVRIAKPIVISTQGLHLLRRSLGPKRRAVRRFLKKAITRSFCTICSSRAEYAELRAFASPDDLRIIHNGVTLPTPSSKEERRKLRRELGLNDDEIVVLYLGQLESRKDPFTAVKAARHARANGVRIVLLIAGAGPLASELRRQQDASVRLLGHFSNPMMLLRSADIFVMPSLREGLSLAVLEAMSFGLAVVVSDGPGNPEVVGDTGLIAPVGNSSAFCKAFERLANDVDLRATLGAAARQRVAENFTTERFVSEMTDCFERAFLGHAETADALAQTHQAEG